MSKITEMSTFYSGPALLTIHQCSSSSWGSGGNRLAISLLRDKNKYAHRAAVALQTFLPCFHPIWKVWETRSISGKVGAKFPLMNNQGQA